MRKFKFLCVPMLKSSFLLDWYTVRRTFLVTRPVDNGRPRNGNVHDVGGGRQGGPPRSLLLFRSTEMGASSILSLLFSPGAAWLDTRRSLLCPSLFCSTEGPLSPLVAPSLFLRYIYIPTSQLLHLHGISDALGTRSHKSLLFFLIYICGTTFPTTTCSPPLATLSTKANVGIV